MHPLIGTTLTAFCILLKHVSGIDRFIVSTVCDMRKRFSSDCNYLTAGPLTNMLPVKATFGASDTVWKQINRVSRAWRRSKRVATCPWIALEKEEGLAIAGPPPIQYEFITLAEVEQCESVGVPWTALMDKGRELDCKWSFDPSADGELRLILAEQPDGTLEGCLRYRTDVLPVDKV
jgi:hypothetical protein